MKSKFILVWLCFFVINVRAVAQDFTFSQFYESPLLRNPALAGIMSSDLRILSSYRSQWGAVTVPYQTQALGAELRMPFNQSSDFITAGLQITNDLAGDSKLGRLQVMPSITFHKALFNDLNQADRYLNFSLMGGYTQSQFDASKLVFASQFQGGQAPVLSRTSISYGDLSAGISYSTNNAGAIKYYVGLAGYHLIRSRVSFDQNDNSILKPRYVLNGGFNMQSGAYDRFYAYGDYIMQGGSRQLLFGLLYKFSLDPYENDDEELGTRSLVFGGSYRWADAFIPVVKVNLGKFFLGTSYDINISKLKAASQYRGGLEVTAGYINNLNLIQGRGVRCPNF